MRIEKMSESKPTEDASLCQGAVETEVDHWLQDESGRCLLTDPMAAGV